MFISVWIEGESEPVYFKDLGSDLHFAEMRRSVHDSLENKKQYGSRFPVFLKTPLSYADFSPKRVEALEKEILTIIKEKKSLRVVPKYKHGLRNAGQIVKKLKFILKGCRLAIDKNKEFVWIPDFHDEIKACAIIDETLKYLRQKGKKLYITRIPLNDGKTFKLISSGKSKGCYLLEDTGLRKILKNTSIDKFEDLITYIALYTPGLFGKAAIEDFIKRKDGQIPVRYEIPQLKEILDRTYGVIIYNEQISEILLRLGGMSRQRAEILRKAMGRKEKEIVEKYTDVFINGAASNGISRKKTERLFGLLNYYSEYAVSKSFATTHAKLAFQTAYLKAHYPTVFNEVTTSLHNLLLLK